MSTISNDENVMDSRDVETRIAELEGMQIVGSPEEGSGLDEEEAEELATLKELSSEGESASADWQYGATLIRDSYFEDYARQTADDLGGVKEGWPYDYIDWERAADALLMDYTSIDFDGVTYWVRS